MSEALPRTTDRGPPRAARLLVPVWGYRYVKQFLEFSLPTMLSAGNVPALAKTLPCTFVFLTSADDVEFITDHPGHRLLSSICRIEIQPIDDLITGDNHSTTITLAYERAVRATGPDMLDTCFFFLICDYLVADGSFRNVLSRIMAGASGVFAGNFQIVEEEAAPEFHQLFEGDGPELTIEPRELMRWALRHLHPMTAANTVNFPLAHSTHSNRLFWRVDNDTLIGRFYLMHMIAIRPELTDFVIGASCDYSFMPEMCPSGAIDVLTDSDEYLVVEMQPRPHESGFLRIGSFDPDALAESLSEWTTARHRENVRSTLVYHAGDIPETLAATIGEADRFIALVDGKLSKAPQPHRDHWYWIGAIAAHRWALARLAESRGAAASGMPDDARPPWTLSRTLQDLRIRLFGRPPYVRPWHPRCPDYRLLLERLQALLADSPGTLLAVGRNTVYLKGWASGLTPDVKVMQTSELLDLQRRPYTALVKKFPAAFALIGEGELPRCAELIARLLPLVADGGFAMLAVINNRADATNDHFSREFAYRSSALLNVPGVIVSARFVPITWLRAAALRWLLKLDRLLSAHPILAPLLAGLVAVAALATYVANRTATETHARAQRYNGYSGVLVEFRPRGPAQLPKFRTDDDGYWARRRVQRLIERQEASVPHEDVRAS
jgi:hypothetical protein